MITKQKTNSTGMTLWDGTKARSEGKHEVSMEEFGKWLFKFDADRDGKISADEFREAIRANGVWFSKLKAKRGLKMADKNSNGAIDRNEICNLVAFAEKHFGVVIVED